MGRDRTLPTVAFAAGGDDIAPLQSSSHAPWYIVVQGQVMCLEMFAAVLAPVAVPKKDIAPSKGRVLICLGNIIVQRDYAG